MDKDKTREKILDAIGRFLSAEQVLAGNSGYTNKEMKQRLGYFVDHLKKMKKDLK